MMCEKCWRDAFNRAYGGSKSQAECYQEILDERKNKPCTLEQQAGEYWDKENKCDTRNLINGKRIAKTACFNT
jgi:hypothetical protein